MRILALLCLVAACVSPRVVTVVTPYTPVIAYEYPDSSTTVGGTRCDKQGHSYIIVSAKLSPEQEQSVRRHEDVHVLQAESYGGCRKFAQRYDVDSLFRLAMEAESYCAAFIRQRALHVPPDPDYPTILGILMYQYNAKYTRDAVVDALPCG